MDGSMPALDAIAYAMQEIRNAETTRGALALDQGASPTLLRMLKDHLASAQGALEIARRNHSVEVA